MKLFGLTLWRVRHWHRQEHSNHLLFEIKQLVVSFSARWLQNRKVTIKELVLHCANTSYQTQTLSMVCFLHIWWCTTLRCKKYGPMSKQNLYNALYTGGSLTVAEVSCADPDSLGARWASHAPLRIRCHCILYIYWGLHKRSRHVLQK